MEQTVHTFRIIRKVFLNERSKDLLLASLIAAIGLTGSYLVLGKSFQGEHVSQIPNQDEPAASKELPGNASSNATAGAGQQSYQYHEEYLLVEGSMLVGDVTRVTNLVFQPAESYLIDYGNGIRHQMTSGVMSIRYPVAGIYLLQCYKKVEDQWQLLAAETVTIRKPQHHESIKY